MSHDMPLIIIATLLFAGSCLAESLRSNTRKSVLGSPTVALVVCFCLGRVSDHYKRSDESETASDGCPNSAF